MLSGIINTEKNMVDPIAPEQEQIATVLNLLVCSMPGCHRYLYTPIKQCNLGHNLCIGCLKSKSQSCPLCNKPILKTHNVALESISSKLLEPCKNRERGCPETVPKKCGNLVPHALQCPYRSCFYSCFASKCPWNGTIAELYAHMAKVHSERVFNGEQKLFKIKKLNSRDNINIMIFMVTNFGMFWAKIIFLKAKNSYFGAVQYVGPSYMANKYRYRFEITTAESYSEKHLQYVRNTHEDSACFDKIFLSQDCLCLPFEFAQYLSANNVLGIQLTLEQAQKSK